MRNALDKNRSPSPINISKDTKKSRLEFLRLRKPNIHPINTKLNSTLSPKQLQPKIKQSQQSLDFQQIQSPSKTNKFFVFNSQNNQSPKTKNNNLSYQLEKNQLQQKFNLSKINNSQQKSTFNKSCQQRRDDYFINKKNKTQDDSNLKNGVESKEEISIWEENKLNANRVNDNQFIDSRRKQLDFQQTNILCPALYQQSQVSPINTIQQVQILSQNFNKEIPVEQLQQQQSYLDKYYEIQKKNKAIQQQQNKLLSDKNSQKFIQKCQTERIERSKTSFEKSQFTSTKLKQQNSKQQPQNLRNKPQKELLHDQFEKIQKDLQKLDLLKQISQKEKDLQYESNLSPPPQQKQQYDSQKKHKFSIDQKQISKLIQNKLVPVRYIDLTDDDNNNDDDDDDDNYYEDYDDDYNCEYINQNKNLDNTSPEDNDRQEYEYTEADTSTNVQS